MAPAIHPRIGRRIRVRLVGDGYEVLQDYRYYSRRYNRFLTVRAGCYSDGATFAPDLPKTDAWIIHDCICRYGVWDDGTRIDNWTASMVLSDLLRRDGYPWRARWWKWGTFLFGGGAARKNGMWYVKQEKVRA